MSSDLDIQTKNFKKTNAINTIIVALRVLMLICLMGMLLYYYINQLPQVFSVALWFSIGSFAVLSILESWQEINRIGSFKPLIIILIAFGATIGIFTLIGYLNKWETIVLPQIWGAYVGILIIVSLAITMIIFSMGSTIMQIKKLSKSAKSDGYLENMKISFSKQKYSLSMPILFMGAILVFYGSVAEINVYIQYIVGFGLMLPFIMVLILDLTSKEAKDENFSNWVKKNAIWNGVIESLIFIVLFFAMTYAIWQVFDEGFQAVYEFKSWVLTSFFISLGLTLLVHIFLSRDSKESFKQFGEKNLGIKTTNDASATSAYSYYFLQIIITTLLIIDSIVLFNYLGYMINGDTSVSTIFLAVILVVIFIGLVQFMSAYYIEYYSVKNKVFSYPFKIGLILFTILIGYMIIFQIYALLNPIYNYIIIGTICIGSLIAILIRVPKEAKEVEEKETPKEKLKRKDHKSQSRDAIQINNQKGIVPTRTYKVGKQVVYDFYGGSNKGKK